MNYQTLSKIGATVLIATFLSCQSTQTQTPTSTQQDTNTQQRPQRGEKPSAAGIIAKMDTNGDGQLSSSETKGRLAERFSTIDTNSDGFITPEELENAPRPERREGGKRPRQ